MRPYGAAIIALLILGMGGVTAWLAAKYFLGISKAGSSRTHAAPTAVVDPALRTPPWVQDVLGAFENATQKAKIGDVTGAEVQVDGAIAEMEAMRVRSASVPSDFFARASSELDDILKTELAPGVVADKPDTDAPRTDGASDMAASSRATPPDTPAGRLLQHVTQARVELAALRSWQETIPPHSELALDVEEDVERSAEQAGAARYVNGAQADAGRDPLATGGKLKLPAGHVDIEAPRELERNTLLDPASLHAIFLDASLMPDTSEILLPPESREFSDNVRVENLMIAGASQTLDGIHWHNVTFIGTRLRYEDGPLDLQNVRFIHCTFGFPSDQRGAALAGMIALDGTSLTIQ